MSHKEDSSINVSGYDQSGFLEECSDSLSHGGFRVESISTEILMYWWGGVLAGACLDINRRVVDLEAGKSLQGRSIQPQ